jgi:ribonuclease P protein component
VILHPRRVVIEMEFAKLEREVAQVFRGIQAAITKGAAQAANPESAPPPSSNPASL